MMKAFRLLVIFALFATPFSVSASTAEVTEAELMRAASELAKQYDASYAARDPDALAALYTADAVLLPTSGEVLRGRDAIRAFYARRLAAGAGNHSIEVIEVHVQGDGGFGLARYAATIPGRSGELHDVGGSMIAVYQRSPDGSWHMRLAEPSLAQPTVGSSLSAQVEQ